MPARTTWSDERCEWLRSLTDRKLTTRQIATELRVTRNAVIGKQHRMGLSSLILLTPEQINERKAAVARRRAAWNAARVLNFRLRPVKPKATTEAIVMHVCTFWELTPGNCRWPVETAGTPGFLFCGEPSIEGKPYCLFHCRMAYTRTPGARRDYEAVA